MQKQINPYLSNKKAKNMLHIHTHKVIDNATGVAIKTGTGPDCKKYIDAVPDCSGPFPLEGEEFTIANFVNMDNIKEECLQGCREINPLNPVNAAAAYPGIIKCLKRLTEIVDTLSHPSYAIAAENAKILLEKATKL